MSREVLVDTTTLRVRGSNPDRARNFLFCWNIKTVSGSHPASCTMNKVVSFHRGKAGRDVKLTTHLRLVRRKRMSGAVNLFSLCRIALLLQFLTFAFEGDTVQLVKIFPTVRRNVLFLCYK